MAVNLTINGTTYAYPETGDVEWGPDATDWASAVTSGMLQKAGGLFQLTAEVDFGTAFGVKSLYYKSRTTNVASTGQIRLARADEINFRNQANSADLVLTVNASNNLTFNGVEVVGSFTVADTATIDLDLSATVLTANIVAGSITNTMVSNSAAIAYSKLNLSGSIVNADINASAAIAYSKLNLATSIVNADISASAAIAFSKLATLSSGNILVGSGANVATSVAMSGAITIDNTGATTYNGVVPMNKGGTNKNMTASAGAVAYSDADSLELTAVGTSGQFLQSNGTSAPTWITAITPWAAYTPTGSWVSNTTYTGFWRRVGDSMEVQIRAVCSGAPTSSTWTGSIPATYTIDTAKLLNSGVGMVLGQGQVIDVGTEAYPVFVTYNNTTTVIAYPFGTVTGANPVNVRRSGSGDVAQNVPITFGSGDYISITFTVPIVEFA